MVLRADRQGLLRFASLKSSIGAAVRARHPELARIDSLVLVESYEHPDERVVIKSTAVLRVWRMLGWPWKVLLVGYLVPREIRDSLYDVVAWWRLRLFGRYASCPVPPPEVRDRFLAL